jgi:hypothetical protein
MGHMTSSDPAKKHLSIGSPAVWEDLDRLMDEFVLLTFPQVIRLVSLLLQATKDL